MVMIQLAHEKTEDPRLRASLQETQELSERLTHLAKLAQDAVVETKVAGVELPGLKSLEAYLSEQFGERSL